MKLLLVGVGTVVFLSLLAWVFDSPYPALFMLVFATPLIKSVELPFVGERLAIFEILFVLTAVLLFTSGLPRRNWRLRVPSEIVPLGLLVLFASVSLFNSYDITNGILMVVILIYYLAFLTVFVHLVEDIDILKYTIHVYLASAVVVIATGLIGLVSLYLDVPSPFVEAVSNRVIATFREPNQLPSFLLTVLPIFLLHPDRHRSPKHNVGFLLAGMLTVAVIIGSGSDGSMMIVAVQALLVCAYKFYLGEFGARTVHLTGAAFALAFVAWTVVAPSTLTGPAAIENSFSIFTRENYSLKALSHARYMQFVRGLPLAMHHHPVFGIGVGSFATFMQVHFGGGGSMHNTYLGVLAESGLLGGIAFFTFLALVGRKAILTTVRPIDDYWKMMSGGILIGLLGLLGYGMAHYGLRQRQLWILFGFVIVLGNITKQQADDRIGPTENR